MNHRQIGRKFGRKRGDRVHFVKTLMNNLVLKEDIKTTVPRAKEIRGKVEKLVTLGKKQNLASLRLLTERLNKKAAMKVYYELSPKYKDRKGGYLKIIKLPMARKRDGADVAEIKFV